MAIDSLLPHINDVQKTLPKQDRGTDIFPPIHEDYIDKPREGEHGLINLISAQTAIFDNLESHSDDELKKILIVIVLNLKSDICDLIRKWLEENGLFEYE